MRIYVGNIPYTATERQLKEHFEQAGDVQKVEITLDRNTHQPRGFGFLDMSEKDGQRAIEKLHGREFAGRKLTVNEALERPSKQQNNSGWRGNRGRG